MAAPESKTSKRILTGRQREIDALELRKSGATYSSIAKAMGISLSGAADAVKRALARLNERSLEGADELRRLELERLDRMLLAMYPQATRGNQGSVDRVLRIMERRARLLGLDAPIRNEHSGVGGRPIATVNAQMDVKNDVSELEQLLAILQEAGLITVVPRSVGDEDDRLHDDGDVAQAKALSSPDRLA